MIPLCDLPVRAGGTIVAIFRIIARTSRLSSSDSVSNNGPDIREEANLFFGKFAEHFAGLAILSRVRAGKKSARLISIASAILASVSAREPCGRSRRAKIAAEKAGAAFDITLGKAVVASVGSNHFADIHFGLLFLASSHFLRGYRSLQQTVSYELPRKRHKVNLGLLFLSATPLGRLAWAGSG